MCSDILNIYMNTTTKEDMQKIVNECFDKKDAAKRLKIAKDTFNKYCKIYNINIDHFNPYLKNKNRVESITKKCLICETIFKVTPHEKDKNYCSYSCARKHPHTEETKKKLSQLNKGQIPWNYNKIIVNKISKLCPICKKEFKVYPNENNRIYCSKVCYKKDTNCTYRKVGKGGYRQGSGYGKHGWYKGFWCDSTYELCFLIYCLDNNVPIKRNNDGYEYSIDNIIHKYYPDFKIDEYLIEIKGYHTNLVDTKLESTKIPTLILYKKDLKFVFEYVNTNYTKNYQSLYDNYKPAYNYKCTHCNKDFSKDNIVNTISKFCSRTCAGSHRAKIKHNL